MRKLQFGLLTLVVAFGIPLGVQSQPFLLAAPPAVQQLVKDRPAKPLATALTPSQKGLTAPSLWWIDRQYGQKLVVNWLVYPANRAGQKQVNLIVRSDIWSRYGYSERYAAVNHFGTFANEYGHQLLVLNRQGTALAAYVCDLAQPPPAFVKGALDFRQQVIPEYPPSDSQSRSDCQIWLSPITAQSGF
jgi:hypothetical protein